MVPTDHKKDRSFVSLKTTLLMLLFATCAPLYATSYQWVGAVSSDWHTAANWSPSTGAPGAGDDVVVVATAHAPELAANVQLRHLLVLSGDLDLGGYTLQVDGSGDLMGGTIRNGILHFGSALSNARFEGAWVRTMITGDVASVHFNGSRFDGTIRLNKQGGTTDIGAGGNVFVGAVDLRTFRGTLVLGGLAVDTFHTDLALSNSGVGGFRIGESAGGVHFSTGKKLYVGAGGFSSGTLRLERVAFPTGTAQTITLTDDARLVMAGGCAVGGVFQATAPRIQSAGNVYHGNTTFTKTGTGTDVSSGGNTFHQQLHIKVQADELRIGDQQPDVVHGDLDLSCSDGTKFRTGMGGGGVHFPTGGVFHNTAGSVGNAELELWGVHMSLTNATNLDLGTTASLTIGGSSYWGGPLTVRAGSIRVLGSTFMGAVHLTKQQALADINNGGNQFHGGLTLSLAANGTWTMADLADDHYHGPVVLNATGAGRIQLGGTSSGPTVYSTLSIGTGFGTAELVLRNYRRPAGAPHSIQLLAANSLRIEDGCVFTGHLVAEGGRVVVNGTRMDAGGELTKLAGNNDVSNGGNLISGPLHLVNKGGAIFDLAANIRDTWKGAVRVSNIGAGTIRIGNGTGGVDLEGTLSIGPSGFATGSLVVQGLKQTGNSHISLDMEMVSATFTMTKSTWQGEFVLNAPMCMISHTVFGARVDITRTSALPVTWLGGNVYHADMRLDNAGGSMNLGIQASDHHHGTAHYIRRGAGGLVVGNSTPTYFHGDITTAGSLTPVQFGGGVNLTHVVGSDDQRWSGPASVVSNVRHLVVNKPSGRLTIAHNVQIPGTLTLTHGVVETLAVDHAASGLLWFTSSALVNGSAHNAAYVEGYVRKVGNTPFVFPIGDAGRYMPAAITAPTSTTAAFTARYRRMDPHPTFDRSVREAGLQRVSACGYWNVERSAGSDVVRVGLHRLDENLCNPTQPADLVVARWDDNIWRDLGQYTSTIAVGSALVWTELPPTTYSVFTLGTRGTVDPLPIELLGLDAQAQGRLVRVAWSTATERNNERFEVERSADASTFMTIGGVPGAGNSTSMLYYSWEDEAPLNGTSYYRLRQVDHDGKYSLSPTVVVLRNYNGAPAIYPNPVEDHVRIVVPSLPQGGAIKVLDAIGRCVEQVWSGGNDILSLPTADWPTGVYQIILEAPDGRTTIGKALKL